VKPKKHGKRLWLLIDNFQSLWFKEKINDIYLKVGQKIEDGQFKDALEIIFDFVRFGNKYYDTTEPWKTRTENKEKLDKKIIDEEKRKLGIQ
jgi:methionyl-tRNA synthetase